MTSTWDIADRRTQITWPDSFYVNYDYLTTGEVSAIRENGATSGVGVLATYAYDNLGRRTGITRGNGTSTSYGYDAVSRLSSLSEDLSGTTYDQTLGFSYNPASEIAQNTRSNDNYAWGGHGTGSTSSTTNGLNQLTAIGSTTPTYDSKGNLTYAGGTTYAYSSENLLTSASGGVALTYDPAMRLYQLSGGSPGTQRFAYDGSALIAEYNGSNTMLRRYVHGPGTDEPIVWYEGSGTTDRRFLHADERGTIVAVTNSSGTTLSVNTYDEYGKPGSSNSGRFQYTGQAWLPELGVYYYKARMYASGLGRFMQTDPIGFGGGMNLYVYVHANPINFVDPLGLMSHAQCDAVQQAQENNPNNMEILACGGSDGGGVSGNGAALLSTSGDGDGEGSGSGSGMRAGGSFVINKETPPNSKVCTAGGVTFLASKGFDAGLIAAAGAFSGVSSAPIYVGHYGDFDFQRVTNAAGNTTFYTKYTDVSNFAVGMYLYGAGVPQSAASAIADTVAGVISSNGATAQQAKFRNLAYAVAKGKIDLKCK